MIFKYFVVGLLVMIGSMCTSQAQVFPHCSHGGGAGACLQCGCQGPGNCWISCPQCTREDFSMEWPGSLESASCFHQTLNVCSGTCTQTYNGHTRPCKATQVSMTVRCDNGDTLFWVLRQCCAAPVA
jgi:hypothetical protein